MCEVSIDRKGRRQLYFECPFCWETATGKGSGFRDRPRSARPAIHRHGGGRRPGDGDGHRVAHCYWGSPFLNGGYVLKEVRTRPRQRPKRRLESTSG
jgi:hypothetical protein